MVQDRAIVTKADQ